MPTSAARTTRSTTTSSSGACRLPEQAKGSSASPGEEISFRLLLRNNLERAATFAARLLPPPGWTCSTDLVEIPLDAGERGELTLAARAPETADPKRRMLAAEILIDGHSQGPLSEALATVHAGR